MKIDSQTRISDIIRHDSRAIDAIASVNPHFNKLRNPILRRVLAPRVTVKDAARIGGCSVEEILAKLECIGFETNGALPSPPAEAEAGQDERILSAIEEGRVEPMDVRPILESGVDPFQAIMEKLKSLPEDHTLEVINSFEPVPLIKLLGKKGYASMVHTEGNAVHTWFLKVGDAAAEQPRDLFFRITPGEMEQKKASFGHRLRETDVRDLEMPLPMVTILNELEDLPEGFALFVHHKKTPQYLLPELEERSYQTWIADLGDGNVKLLIHH